MPKALLPLVSARLALATGALLSATLACGSGREEADNGTQAGGWKATNSANAKDARNGNWSWQLTGNATLSQSLAELPNGTYTLSVWAKGSAAGATLFVKNHGGAMATTTITAGNTWHEAKLEKVVVTSGAAELGVTSSGQTVALDDFSFVAE